MNTNYLFPNYAKRIGWLLAVPSFILLCLVIMTDSPDFMEFTVFSIIPDDFLNQENPSYWVTNNLADEVLTLTTIIGGLLIAFSKEKKEDEYISEIRKSSVIWAVYVNYALYMLATITIYGFDFLWVLQFNVLTLLIVLIVRYEWYKYQLKKSLYEE